MNPPSSKESNSHTRRLMLSYKIRRKRLLQIDNTSATRQSGEGCWTRVTARIRQYAERGNQRRPTGTGSENIMPLLSEHRQHITLNEKLFARVKEVYAQKESGN